MKEDNIAEMIKESFNKQYKYIKFLGEGAYAKVYLVKHNFLDDKRAIKIIKQALGDNSNTEKVFYEVKIATQLRHENIISIHDAGIITQNNMEYAYFVLEYVNGGDLEEYNKSYTNINLKIPVPQVLNIILQISKGLNVLHSSNPPIIHRDLKNANILLTYDDKGEILIKISDFGVASEITPSNENIEIAGTMPYMAPECFQKNFSTQTDIYAVGVIFYQLLTNHFPYNVDEYDKDDLVLLKPWKNKLKSTTEYNDEVLEYIDNVVKKCLSITPEDRYENAAQLLDDLELIIKRCKEDYEIISHENNPVEISNNNINLQVKKALKLAKTENKLDEAIEILEKEVLKDYDIRKQYSPRLSYWKSEHPDIKLTMEAFYLTLRGQNYNVACQLLDEAFAYNPSIKNEYLAYYKVWKILDKLQKDYNLFEAIQQLEEEMTRNEELEKMYINLIDILRTCSVTDILNESKKLAQANKYDDASKLLEFIVVYDKRIEEEYSYKLSLWKQNLEM